MPTWARLVDSDDGQVQGSSPAFVLNRMEYLPDMYSNVVEAWERLDNWQGLVKRIQRN